MHASPSDNVLCCSICHIGARPRRDGAAHIGNPHDRVPDLTTVSPITTRAVVAQRLAGDRASQAQPAFADITRIIVNRKENVAARIAGLIIPAVGYNKLRHETLQRFMLTNDSVTVAIEIPIWLTESDIIALEKQHGIELAPRVGAADRSITGHIDFLQVRNGAVHILDYKPDARTNKPIAHLCARVDAARPRPEAVRHQMCVVQRGRVQ